MYLNAFFGGVREFHLTLKRDHGSKSYEPWTRVLGALTKQLFDSLHWLLHSNWAADEIGLGMQQLLALAVAKDTEPLFYPIALWCHLAPSAVSHTRTESAPRIDIQ